MDLARRDAVTVAGVQQNAALRQALTLAQRNTRTHLHTSATNAPSRAAAPQTARLTDAHARGVDGDEDGTANQKTTSDGDIADDQDLASALARRRSRSRVLARWARHTREAELFGLARCVLS